MIDLLDPASDES